MAIGLVADDVEIDETFELVVSSDPMKRAAEILTEVIARLAREVEVVRLAIPGGSALDVVPRSRSALGEGWSGVALTWVDERCVPEKHPDSNRGAAGRLGLFASKARDEADSGVPPRGVLELYCDGETPEAAARRATEALRREFSNAIDVSLLGMGGDGHIASIFPEHRHAAGEMVVHVSDSPKPPSDRITLTRRALETAQVSLLVAIGESKREALTRLVRGDASLSAHGLPGLVVVTDLILTR